MSKSKRLFIAVEMPSSVIQELQRIQRFLKKENLFHGRYVDSHHAHITLKFLGDVKESIIPRIQEQLKHVADNSKFGSMSAQLGSLGLFKSAEDIPRVLYLSISCPELTELAQEITNALSDLFETDRPFVSHLTIARIKKIDDYDILKDLLDSLKVEPVRFLIDSFVLNESVLTSDGPVYKRVALYTF